MKLLFLIPVFILTACAAGEPIPESELPGHKAALPPSLASVMSDELLAIASENPPVREAALKEANAAVKAADSASLLQLRSAMAEECRVRSPYCGVYRQLVRKKMPVKEKQAKEIAKDPKLAKVSAALHSGKFAAIASADERLINYILSQIIDRDELNPIVDKALATKSCAAAKVEYLIAAKTEELLPSENVRKNALTLYERVAHCKVNDFSERAQFRASLHLIWNKEADRALVYLRSLLNARNDDYRVRGVYWLLRLGKLSDEEKTKLLEILRRKYPFQLHSLLALRGQIEAPFKIAEDSVIHFRTQKQHWLNSVFRASEALLELQKPELARYALTRVGIPVLRTEPEFQLYYSYLLNRAGAYALKFSMLSALFQHHPEFLSVAALKLHFPEKTVVNKMSKSSTVDEMLLYSLIRQESKFNPEALSHAGAVGLMQILPETARKMEEDITEEKLFEPEQNIRLGIQYLRQLMDRYDGDVELALAAYNAGPHRVDDWLKRYPVNDRILFLDLIPFRETRLYVASIAGSYYWYNHVYGRADSVAGRGFKAWDN